MLKQRIVTASILLIVFLLLLYYLSPLGFAAFSAGIVIWGAWEWTYFMGISKLYARFIYLLCLIIFGCILLYVSAYLLLLLVFIWLVFIWWCLAAILIALYPRGAGIWGHSVFLRGVMGCFVLIPCWIALNIIRHTPLGIYHLLFVFALVWSADIGAYFVGKRWGKHKLAQYVSPGKTIEGTIGGIICAMLVATLILWYAQLSLKILPFAYVLVLLTVLFSVVGDLFESMMKRQAGLKDSGRLLPGHGGLLDRIDSLTAAAPVYLFASLFIARYLIVGTQ